MSRMFALTLTLLTLNAIVPFVSACNNVELLLVYLKNCPDVSNIIKVNRVNVTLDRTCHLVPTGTRTITKDYSTAQGSLSLEPPIGKKVSTKINLCKPAGANPLVSKVLNLLAIPLDCPAKKGTQRLQDKQDISFLKNSLRLTLGETKVQINLQHDNGVSCLEAVYNLQRKQ